jgi:hypothetical protein
MHQLRESYFGNRYPAYHYLVFAHYVDCPNNYNYCSCRSFLLPGMTGEAELPGNDAIVSTGPFMDSGFAVEPETWSALMMHEVGHNFGLRHGGADDTNYKPNYLSVMNYDFEWSGVFLADAPGSINLQSCTTDADCTAPAHCAFPPGGLNNCVRIDYSSAQAPDLNENSLDETAGLNISPTSVDVGFYYALGDTVLLFAPTNGAPVDWNDDGNATETSVATDLNADFFLSDLQSRNDWATNGGILANFNFDFQCTSGWQGDGPPTLATRLQPTNRSSRMTRTIFSPEPTLDSARKHHRLYAPRTVSIRVNPGCSAAAKPVAAGQPGTIRVALLGADRFDVNDVDTSSLALHGAKAIGVSIQDINNDGKPDLVATFDSASVKVHPRASVARVTGWLKNSQAFFGEDKIKVVSSQAAVDAQCK